MAFGVILRGFLFQCFILMSRVQGFDMSIFINWFQWVGLWGFFSDETIYVGSMRKYSY